MAFLIGFLTVLQLLAAFLLIGIILIQQSKAGGGLGAMGGGTTETVFGATAGNVLTKGTVILASIFLGAALLVQILNAKARPTASATEALTSDKPAVEEVQTDAKTDEAAAEAAAAEATEGDEAKATEEKTDEAKTAEPAKTDEAATDTKTEEKTATE